MQLPNLWRGLWGRKRPNSARVSTRGSFRPLRRRPALMVTAAEVSACVAQQLLANERIRIGAQHNRARLSS